MHEKKREKEMTRDLQAPPTVLRIFLIMFKLGALTFGGGWSVIAQMQQDIVEKRGWLTSEELMDLAVVGRSLPGIMVINTATQVGYHLLGIPGALAAIIGTALPSMLIIMAITLGYQKFRDNVIVAKALNGVRAAVLPILLTAVLTMKATALKNRKSYVVAGVSLLFCLFAPVSDIWVIIGGVIVGMLWMGGDDHAVS